MTWTVQSVQETHTTTAEASMTASVDHGRHRQLVSNSFVWAGYIYIIAKKLQKKYTELKFKSYLRLLVAIIKPKHSFCGYMVQECRKKMTVFFLFLSIL